MITAHQAAQLQVKEEAINQLNWIVEMLRWFVDKMLPVTPGAIELIKLHHPTKVRNWTPFEWKSLTPNRPC
jgi:hypothetical protein